MTLHKSVLITAHRADGGKIRTCFWEPQFLRLGRRSRAGRGKVCGAREVRCSFKHKLSASVRTLLGLTGPKPEELRERQETLLEPIPDHC